MDYVVEVFIAVGKQEEGFAGESKRAAVEDGEVVEDRVENVRGQNGEGGEL